MLDFVYVIFSYNFLNRKVI